MAASYHRKSSFSRCLLGAAALLMGACAVPDFGGDSSEDVYPVDRKRYGVIGRPATADDQQSIFGKDGLTLFGGGEENGGGGVGVGVNSFLWRGSLDTISFMPLSSADPFGGVIITDWYTPPEASRERFKTTVYILSRELRANGLRVAVFRQRLNGDGTWSDAEVSLATRVEIEDAILSRARQLRVAAVAE